MIAAAPLILWLAAADPAVTPARALFDRAEVQFNLGHFEAAAADYQAAYELDHRPALLFDIGQCYRNLGNYERARFYYRRFLALDPRTPNRRDTEKLIDMMSSRLDQPPARTDLAPRDPAPPSTAAPAFAPSVPRVDAQPAPEAAHRPVYRRAWFWGAVAGVVAGGVAAGLLLSRDDPHGSLPSIDVRNAGLTAP